MEIEYCSSCVRTTDLNGKLIKIEFCSEHTKKDPLDSLEGRE